MTSHERTLAAIQGFYDAAMDETLWPAVLSELVALTDSQAASFWVLDGSDQPRLPTFVCYNFDLEIIAEYLDHVAPLDPTVQYLVAHPKQPIVHDGLVISEREKDLHPYYDWHERHIDTRFRMVGQATLAPTLQAGVALHRTRKAGRYESNDVEQFTVLHEHLKRALKIAARLGSLDTMQRLSIDRLDQCDSAIFFLDKRKRIVQSSRRAQHLQHDGDGVRVGVEGITLTQKKDNDILQELIAQALSPINATGTNNRNAMQAARPSGKRPYGILVTAVSIHHSALSAFRPAVCVIVTDPERRTLLPPDQLQAVFGLTRGEARLAAILATGEDLRTAAEMLNVAYGTARTRLIQIFQKTETRRQCELVRILLTTLGATSI